MSIGEDDIHPESDVLRFPFQDGQRWNYGAIEMTMVGTERVKVPAGTFMTVHVEKIPLYPDAILGHWYAPDIGVVRRTIRAGERGPEHVEVLVSFTPGQE